LAEKLAEDPQVLLLGQDICDPFGGCFRLTQGFSTKFGKRVMNTPISEAATVGTAIGLAMQGFKPVVEIMFCNFLALTVDQLLHNAVKVHQRMQPINITIRAPIGKEAYGFTHEGDDMARMLEPFMKVVRLGLDTDIKAAIKAAIDDPGPVLVIEDSKLYVKRLN
jgi:pyruvate/2-oxoglutarate/acetoin dehydrogenase E1 component